MRILGIAMTLGVLSACTKGNADTASEQPATLALSYVWTGFDNLPDETCGSAWVDTLYVEFEHVDGDYNLRQVACDNDPIDIPDLRSGVWTLELRTVQYVDQAAASFGQSEVVDIDLPGGEVTELEVGIVCQENGHTCDRSE